MPNGWEYVAGIIGYVIIAGAVFGLSVLALWQFDWGKPIAVAMVLAPFALLGLGIFGLASAPLGREAERAREIQDMVDGNGDHEYLV